ncbi:ABC transporter permease [Thermostaphylospora chromogena]|uniref:Xylose transport system permease protein XylH n=1 Tax=Thermostaphylospora chromogena TaxID=35622 RepID=A0A1H1GYT9_9ACTN|nr:ABC transporter permease [Thermostaphylospora chromogena]SDR18347.1 monosaccharide ABC transporter membrane protein, CUT2 family [Thermostaphylospora chromogena]
MTATTVADERLAASGRLRRLLIRPELGAVVGAVLVFAFFASQSATFRSADGVANWLDPASTLGIMAVAVALLMIGGEFDLSAGVLTGTVGLVLVTLATEFGWNVWAAMLAALVVALLVGLGNGLLVVRTRLPSFIVTLGTFLMLQGVNLGVTKALTGTVQVGGLREAAGFETARALLAGTITIGGTQFRVAILWWIGVTALATWVLMRTTVGNWIFAVGGNAQAARAVGVPADRTKVGLFMTTALAAWLVGSILALRLTSVQASAGIGQEFIYIIAAVIGGCLLTGGYGSAVGAAIGALIFGMADKGIVFLGWDADWFMFFLGVMLLLATLANRLVRKYAEEVRR